MTSFIKQSTFAGAELSIMKHLLLLPLFTFLFIPYIQEQSSSDSSLLNTFGQEQDPKPNVLWILIENIGPEFSSYGYPHVNTPNIDKLASGGAIYQNAFTNSPVCSPSRSSLITGMYPNAIGVHHHRSMRQLPDSIKTLPELFDEAGYFTALGNGYTPKKDYNFPIDKKLWNGNDWQQRREGQPFFAQLTLMHSHRGDHWHNPADPKSWLHPKYKALEPVNPDSITLPAVIPNTIYTRDDWAKYLNQIQVVDFHVGKIIERLKQEGLYDNTIIFLMGDNGRDHLMDEYWLYDGGIQVPLIVRWPGVISSSTVNHDLVSGVDISATILNICGIPVPDYFQGILFLGKNAQKRQYVYTARDRIDEAYDMVRSVRGKKFKYIRNFMPDRSYAQYRDFLRRVNPGYPLIKAMAETAPGQLHEVQKKYVADTKPVEELYDITKDPEELNNLADDPKYSEEIKKFRGLLKEWMLRIDDKARLKETPKDIRGYEKWKNNIVFPTEEERYDPAKLDSFKVLKGALQNRSVILNRAEGSPLKSYKR